MNEKTEDSSINNVPDSDIRNAVGKNSDKALKKLDSVIFQIRGDQLDVPGIYEIYCHVTKKSYFGESGCLPIRILSHIRELRRKGEGDARFDTSLLLREDWIKYGPETFEFRILEAGPEWSSPKKRRKREIELIRQNKSTVYNSSVIADTATGTGHAVTCSIDGITYPSVAEAARQLGFSPQIIRRRLFSAKYPAYQVVENVSTTKSIEIDGVVYPSQSDAALALGISRTAIYRRLKTGASLDSLSKLSDSRGTKKTKGKTFKKGKKET